MRRERRPKKESQGEEIPRRKRGLTQVEQDCTFADEVTALGGRGVLGLLVTGPRTYSTSESTASERTTPRFGQ